VSGVKAEFQEMSKAELLAAGLRDDTGRTHLKTIKGAAKKWQRRHAKRQSTLQQPGTMPSYLSGSTRPFSTDVKWHPLS